MLGGHRRAQARADDEQGLDVNVCAENLERNFVCHDAGPAGADQVIGAFILESMDLVQDLAGNALKGPGGIYPMRCDVGDLLRVQRLQEVSIDWIRQA